MGGDVLSIEIERDDAIRFINEAKEKIISIKKKIEEKNNEIPELKCLKEQLDKVYYILGKKQSNLRVDFIDLNVIIDKISKKQVAILNGKTRVMLATIRANLPNDMKIIPDNNDIKEGKLTFKGEDIGTLQIRQESNNIVVNIRINGSDSVDFPVEDELEMYTIINHIITSYNYKVQL